MASEQSRLDEAVEVALRVRPFAEAKTSGRSMLELIDTATDEDAEAAMRAALLAGVKKLLGEPVAWLWSHPSVNDGEWIDSRVPPSDEHRLVGWIGKPLYAPSLGEGDGR